MTAMFTNKQLKKFLRALDVNLTRSFSVDIVGGAAGILSFNISRATEDIDTITSIADIEDSISMARLTTGLDIPVNAIGVWDAPYGYKGRRKRVRIPKVKRLEIYVPEKYDWALMKITRLLDKDRLHIEEAAKKAKFSANTFLRRFMSDMTHIVVVRPTELLWQFLSMMATLYGEAEAEKMKLKIEKNKKWKKILVGIP